VFFIILFKNFVLKTKEFPQRILNKTRKYKTNLVEKNAMQVKTVKGFNFMAQTVGYVDDRYRLVHLWVPEMVLNV